MELPARLLEEITGHCGVRLETQNGAWGRERRRAGRLPFMLRAVIVRVVDGKRLPAQMVRVRDLSAGGLGMLCRERIKAGDPVVICLPRRRNRPLVVCCVVSRCTRVDGGMFVVGARFERMASMAPPAPQHPREEKGSARGLEAQVADLLRKADWH